VEANRGEESRFVKRLGDGYMLAYHGPPEAVAAAVRIGAALRDIEEVSVHMGLHHGVAVVRDGDYFGRAVNLDARLLSAARAGELLATEDVAKGSPEFPWRHVGPMHLRGFADPLEIHALDLEAAANALGEA
jgi:adenylate cyclase